MKSNLLLLSLFFLLPLSLFSQSMEGKWFAQIPGMEEGTTMDLVLEMAAGKYMVDFGNDGTIEIEGVYELQETQMTIKDTGGERACLNQVGVYSFKVTTEDLIMTPISDPCEGRSGPDGMQFTRMD